MLAPKPSLNANAASEQSFLAWKHRWGRIEALTSTYTIRPQQIRHHLSTDGHTLVDVPPFDPNPVEAVSAAVSDPFTAFGIVVTN